MVSIIVESVTVASVLYFGVGSGTVAPEVLWRDLALAALIWRTGAWIIVGVAWSHTVWVVVMDEGMLGLIYFGVRAGTVATGVLGRDIALVASIWRYEPWFLVAVAWIHSVSVVLMDVGMLGMKLVWVRDDVTDIVKDTFHANTCSLYTT